MFNLNSLTAFSPDSLDTTQDVELQQRLGLYRVFLRLYEHHRGLLDEILSLENSGCKSLSGVALPYVQGVILGQQVHLVTNLLKGETQALMQPQNLWTIGRDSRQVVLPIPDKRLSRCHAVIQYNAGSFHLVDLNSSNGTFVNGELIRQSTALRDGDRVRLGSLTFVFFMCNIAKALPMVASEVVNQLQQDEPVTEIIGEKVEDEPLQDILSEDELLIGNPLEDTLLFMRQGLRKN